MDRRDALAAMARGHKHLKQQWRKECARAAQAIADATGVPLRPSDRVIWVRSPKGFRFGRVK